MTTTDRVRAELARLEGEIATAHQRLRDTNPVDHVKRLQIALLIAELSLARLEIKHRLL